MSTAYDIYIKAPQLGDCRAVIAVLEENGAHDPEEITGSEWPERWQVVWPGLGILDVVNERLHRIGTNWQDEPMFGYDFCVTHFVEFRNDNGSTRDAVLSLARILADSFPTVVEYNGEHVLAQFEKGRNSEVIDDSCGFVVKSLETSPLIQELKSMGAPLQNFGLPNE